MLKIIRVRVGFPKLGSKCAHYLTLSEFTSTVSWIDIWLWGCGCGFADIKRLQDRTQLVSRKTKVDLADAPKCFHQVHFGRRRDGWVRFPGVGHLDSGCLGQATHAVAQTIVLQVGRFEEVTYRGCDTVSTCRQGSQGRFASRTKSSWTRACRLREVVQKENLAQPIVQIKDGSMGRER